MEPNPHLLRSRSRENYTRWLKRSRKMRNLRRCFYKNLGKMKKNQQKHTDWVQGTPLSIPRVNSLITFLTNCICLLDWYCNNSIKKETKTKKNLLQPYTLSCQSSPISQKTYQNKFIFQEYCHTFHFE